VKKQLLGASVVLLCIISAPAFAELPATPLPGDSRLVQFEYDADNTFLVLAKPKSVTHMEFGSDEKVITVAAGDTKNWELNPTANRKHLFVKPTFEGLETSLTVITDKRSYQFVLRSTGPGSKWYQRVTWRYGQTMLMELKAEEEAQVAAEKVVAADQVAQANINLATDVKPESLNFNYEVAGDAPFRPTSVFDDGKFTWVRMPDKLNELPALFAASEGDELAIVNYVVKGDYILAQRLMDTGVLRLGKHEVRFTRKAQRRYLFGGN
jgi:P-type conjugative transfer protein VirB9